MPSQAQPMSTTATPCWSRAELVFSATRTYANPLCDQQLDADLVSPSGRRLSVPGFWDGEITWRVRFLPDEVGSWSWRTRTTDGDTGLNGRDGTLLVGPAQGDSRFAVHGAVRLSADGTHLEHADGTPFLWLADTAWCGPVKASDADWQHYLEVRSAQRFTTVQWVPTTWAMVGEDDAGRQPYHGSERIAIDPAWFQPLDRKVAAMGAAGLLSVPVMLWALRGGENDPANASWRRNPGALMNEDDCVRLARYQLARWGGDHVLWILNGDGDYAHCPGRWPRIGQALFNGVHHAPVAVHPCGMNWPHEQFYDQSWFSLAGYQSGHGDDAGTWRWLLQGSPATAWRGQPARPVINLEPPYENHVAYQSRQPHTPFSVRRATWWSLFVAPTAGVTYGGQGVWGWDAGGAEPAAHPGTGIAGPWREALHLPAAEQLRHLVRHLERLPWWRLKPCPELLTEQPGEREITHTHLAAISDDGRAAAVYLPAGGTVALRSGLLTTTSATWCDPRDGSTKPAGSGVRFTAPDAQDWLLVLV